MKKLVSINIDCGRMGSLNALEIYDDQDWLDLEKAQELGLSFHESDTLGKHSEFEIHLSGFDEGEFQVVSEEQDKIEWLQSLFGRKDISGNFSVRRKLRNLLDEYGPEED